MHSIHRTLLSHTAEDGNGHQHGRMTPAHLITSWRPLHNAIRCQWSQVHSHRWGMRWWYVLWTSSGPHIASSLIDYRILKPDGAHTADSAYSGPKTSHNLSLRDFLGWGTRKWYVPPAPHWPAHTHNTIQGIMRWRRPDHWFNRSTSCFRPRSPSSTRSLWWVIASALPGRCPQGHGRWLYAHKNFSMESYPS